MLVSTAIVTSPAKIITVGPAGTYKTIQQAVDEAEEGETIIVGSGTYRENVNVHKQLLIKGMDSGSGYPIVQGDGTGGAISIVADGVRIEGLAVTNPGERGTGICIRSDHATVQGCAIFGNREGVQIFGSGFNTIESNDLYDNYIGLDLNLSDHNVIAGNNASRNNFHGIKLYGSSNNTLRDNVAYYNFDDGISLEEGSDNNLISGNKVSFNAQSSVEFENKNAISIYLSDGNVVSGNEIRLNGGTVARDNGARIYRLGDGVQLMNTKDSVVKNNTMIENHYAVWIDDSENATVTGNWASDAYYNIMIEDSRDCLVADNQLFRGGRNIRALNAHNCTIRNNTMSGGMYDLTLTDSWHNTIENCTWSNSSPKYQSLWLSNSSHNLLKGNRAYHNGGGIWLEKSFYNRLYRNDFLDGVYQASSDNYWHSPGPEEYQYHGIRYEGYLGNRYGDYVAPDSDGNGIGDLPYMLSGVMDTHPLTETAGNYGPWAPEPSPVPSPKIDLQLTPESPAVPSDPWSLLDSYLKKLIELPGPAEYWNSSGQQDPALGV